MLPSNQLGQDLIQWILSLTVCLKTLGLEPRRCSFFRCVCVQGSGVGKLTTKDRFWHNLSQLDGWSQKILPSWFRYHGHVVHAQNSPSNEHFPLIIGVIPSQPVESLHSIPLEPKNPPTHPTNQPTRTNCFRPPHRTHRLLVGDSGCWAAMMSSRPRGGDLAGTKKLEVSWVQWIQWMIPHPVLRCLNPVDV